MKNTDKTQPKQGQGKIKPRVRPAKVEQAEDEREQAEEVLRFLGEIITNMSEGVNLIRASDKKIVYANPRFEEMFGYEPGELIGKNVVILNEETPEKTAQEVADDIERAVIEKGEFILEILNRRKDGTPFWCLAHISTYQHPKYGSVYISVHEEITERKQAEAALHESEERYRGLFENMFEGYAYCQMIFEKGQAQDWVYLAVNDAFENLTGLKNVAGKRATEVIPGIREADPELFDIYARVSLTGKPEKFEMFVEALKMWFSISVYSPEKGFFVAVFDVITERKRAEEALRQRAEELAALQATVLEIATPHDLPSLLHTIVERAARLLNANSGGMYLCDPARDEVRCVVSYNTPQDYTGTMLKYGEGAAGMVAQSGKPLVIDDYRSWGGRAAAFDAEQPFMAVLSAPMLWQGQVMGVIHVLHSMEGRLFSQAELDLLTLFANHAAVAVENTRLYEQAQKEITERKRIEQELQALSSRNEAILVSVPDIIMEVDKDKVYTWANRAGIEFFGEGVVGKEADFYFEGEQETYDVVQPLFNGSENIIYVESWQRRRDGEKRLLAWWCRVLKDVEGNVTGALSTARDITERKQAEKQLQESEAKYRSLFEDVPDGVYRTTPDGLILAANLALVRILGYDSQEELLKTHIADLYLEPGDRKNMVSQLQESDVIRNAEIRLKRKNGTPIAALDNAHAVRDEHGEVLYFEGTLTDITTLKQAETKLELQAEELKQRYAELALLYEAGLTINRELDPRLQLETLFKTAMQALQADHAEFSRYDAARGSVQFEMGIGYSPEVLEKLRALVAHDGEAQGLIGMIAQNRQPLNLPDVHADPHYIDIDPEIRSGLWVPVARENQLLGVLGVLSTRPNAFSDQHERLLSLFANQAAVALENARLFAETNLRLRHVQALRTIDMAISSSLDLQVTFDIFLEQVTQQLGVHAVDILKFDPHMQTLEYAAGRGFRTTAIQKSYFRLGEGLAGRAALERRILHIPDLAAEQNGVVRTLQFENEGFTAYLGVPLIAKGQVKGVLEIFHREPFATDQDWIDFLGILAGQAAIAIENVTLFNDLQRSNVELTLAYDATIEGWSHALDLRDKETEGHTQRVADLTQRLAQVMGVSDHELIHIRRGALLHDIGKMGIPDDILRKPASLDEPEWVVMRQHPLHAYDMLLPISYLRPALDIPYCHHEKWDGSGYPRGLAGEQIPLAARLFAVVDVYDALTSNRPYRKAWSRKKALEYIQQQAGQHFDPEIVSAFLGMPALHELWNGDKISQT